MKTIKGYKAFNKGLICKNFQFKENTKFKHEGEIEICKSGFHFCENPLDVLDYYNLCESEFAEVEAIGKIQTKENKTNTDYIKINFKLSLSEFVKSSVDFVLSKGIDKETLKIASSGDYAQLANSRQLAQIASSGDHAKIASSGYHAKIASSGEYAQIANSGDAVRIDSSGDYAKIASSGESSRIASSGHAAQIASSGDHAKIASSGHAAQIASSGDYSVVAAIGIDNIAKGKKGNWIVLSEWTYNEKLDKNIPICVKSARIDGKKIKEDVYYKLENKKFKEAK